MVTTEIATLERLRCEMGLSRRQMLHAIGSLPRRDTLFDNDAHVDPALLTAAQRLRDRYDDWKSLILSAVPAEESPRGALDTRELAAILGISENYARVLAKRYLTPFPNRSPGIYGKRENDAYQRQYVITRESIQDLFNVNETVLTPNERQYCLNWRDGTQHFRGPLGAAFLRWVEAH